MTFARLLELNNINEYKCVVDEKRFPSHYIAQIIKSEHLLKLVTNQPISLWVECIKNSKEIIRAVAGIKNTVEYFEI